MLRIGRNPLDRSLWRFVSVSLALFLALRGVFGVAPMVVHTDGGVTLCVGTQLITVSAEGEAIELVRCDAAVAHDPALAPPPVTLSDRAAVVRSVRPPGPLRRALPRSYRPYAARAPPLA